MRNVSCLLATAAALLAAPTAVSAQDFKLFGINYNIRAGPDSAPPAEKCKNASQIDYELAILKNVTDRVRLYSLVDCDQASAAIPAIFKAGLKLELGLWVGPNNDVYAAERDRLTQLLTQNATLLTATNVVGIHVGSEAIYRKDINYTTAIANLQEIRTLTEAHNLKVPLTIADIGDTYIAYPALYEAVDYVSANLFPFWEDVAADEAAAQFYTRYSKVADGAAQYNKSVVIGETGWASDGVHSGASEASSDDAATFFEGFYKLAKKHELQYYYFSSFDESWKLAHETGNSTVEGYFGLFHSNGTLKTEYAELELDSTDDEDGEEDEGSSSDDVAATVAPTEKLMVHIKIHRRKAGAH